MKRKRLLRFLITAVIIAFLLPLQVLASQEVPQNQDQWITILDNDIDLPNRSDDGEEDDDGIFSRILDFILHIFIPREDFWEYHFNRLDGRLREKLPFQTYLDTIGRLREVSGALDGDASVLDLTYEINDQQFQLDISRFIAPHLYTARTLITGLYVILLVYYNYRQIMFLIRGTTFNQGSDRGSRD
jgi:hypothetical protein